MFTSR